MAKKILKRDGVVVEFDKLRLVKSLLRANASLEIAEEIADAIEKQIKDYDKTGAIYKLAFDMLKNRESSIAMRYSLRRSLFKFGPTGFPFEKFVAELYSRKGYNTETNVHLQGKCAKHEVDVFAQNSNERIAMEVKFHNDINTKSDMKTVLYVKARFDDLTTKKMFKKASADRCMLFTNTKYTNNARSYSFCAGVDIIGWGYPKKGNIRDLIEEVNAHPVTCLPSITNSDTRYLFNAGIITCRGLVENTELLRRVKLKNLDKILNEARILCKPENRV